MATIPGGAVAIHGYAEIKSKFDAEFRRFSLDKSRYVHTSATRYLGTYTLGTCGRRRGWNAWKDGRRRGQ